MQYPLLCLHLQIFNYSNLLILILSWWVQRLVQFTWSWVGTMSSSNEPKTKSIGVGILDLSSMKAHHNIMLS